MPSTTARDLPSDDVTRLSVRELRGAFAAGTLSPVEATDAILDRLEAVDPQLRAFLTVCHDAARAGAPAAEETYRREPERAASMPLLGVPTTIKDLVPTRGVRTTMGSLTRADWIPDFDTPVGERLGAAGAVLLGKTNTCEFGWKGDAGNRLIGPTRNPWDHDVTAGGSSGGAAAAVASGLGPVAHGTDGAGSVRIPAAFCGLVGIKPSFGRIPYYPASAVSWFAHHGALAGTVEDAWLMVQVLSGADPRDVLSWDAPDDAIASIAGRRVGYCPRLGDIHPEPAVAATVERAVGVLESLGAQVDLVDQDLAVDPYPVLETLWSVAHAARHDADPAPDRDLDPGLLAVIESGRSRSGLDVGHALVARTAYIESVRVATEQYDLLVTPTLPCTAFPAGLDQPGTVAGRTTRYLEWTPFTYPFNLTGYPAVTVPCGLARGHPVGIQFVGRWRADATAVGAAAAYEAAVGDRSSWARG